MSSAGFALALGRPAMLRTARGLLTVVGVLAASTAAAQGLPAPVPAPPPPPTPGTVTSLPYPSDVPPPPPPDPAIGYQYGAPPVPFPPPADGPYPGVPCGCKPGWFGSVDLGLMFPHVSQTLASTVVIQPFAVADTIRLPSAGLDTTVAPQFTLGYRLADDRGAVLLSYRNLASEGSGAIDNYDVFGTGLLTSRLDLNTVTLAYSTAENPLGALWGLRWEAGARLGTIYFDSQAQ